MFTRRFCYFLYNLGLNTQVSQISETGKNEYLASFNNYLLQIKINQLFACLLLIIVIIVLHSNYYNYCVVYYLLL